MSKQDFKYTDRPAGTVFQCEDSSGAYLAVYTGRWNPIGEHIKMEVIKLLQEQNHDTERINATDITNAIDRDDIFSKGDKVRIPFHTGTVQSFSDEFITVGIKTHSRTQLRWPRLVALNAEYATKAVN